MMQLLAVIAVLLFGQCYAASTREFGSDLVRALMREAQPRPAPDAERSLLKSRYDQSEPDFDSKVPEHRPEMIFEDYHPAAAPYHKRESLRKSENLERLALLVRELQDDAAVQSGCNDVQDCKDYYDSKDCWNPLYEHHMRSYCKKTCGYCDCYKKDGNFKYGCCTDDNKVPAEGYNREGCSKKLCIDLNSWCQKKKARCNVAVGDERKELERTCSYTCEYCDTKKAANPQLECESRDPQPPYGCCWDGTAATGPEQKGCRACGDYSSYACQMFSSRCNNANSYNLKKFILECPKTCGRCAGCSDIKGTKYCALYKSKGECEKNYMLVGCRRTCGKCE